MARTKASRQAQEAQDKDQTQLARRTYLKQTLATRLPGDSQGSFEHKRGRGGRKTGRAEGGRRAFREERMLDGVFREYRSMVVGSRSEEAAARPPEVAEEESALWVECAEYHLALASEGADQAGINRAYDVFLAHKIDDYERMAVEAVRGEASTSDLYVVRRLLGILLQEREMLGLQPSQLAAIGFDGAFIATGRSVLARGFRLTMGWYSATELTDHYREKE